MTEFGTGPNGLKGPFDSSGSPVGCKSDCEVGPNPGNSSSCCTGSFNTPATCPSSGVPHYHYFSACFRFPCVDILCNAVFHRVEVPRFKRVCVRWTERDRTMDLSGVVQSGLHGHLLPLSLACTGLSSSDENDTTVYPFGVYSGYCHSKKYPITSNSKSQRFFRVPID